METDDSDNSKISTYRGRLCSICSSTPGRYICPHCNVLYCSVPCYQSEVHRQCSESFYRDSVLERLNSERCTPNERKTMLEILEKCYEDQEEEQVDSDDDCEPCLAERLSGINLDDADAVWEQLTDSEQKGFEELLRVGDVTTLVPQWEPWWKYRKVKELVEEIDSASSSESSNHVESCPAVKEVPQFSSISKSAPSPCVKWNIINVLGAYCYMVRYFNGEHHNTAGEAVSVLATLSANLCLAHNYESYEMATEAVVQQILSCPWLDGSTEGFNTMREDLQILLCGPEESNPSYYMQAALSDIHELFLHAKQGQNTDSTVCKKSKFGTRFGEHQSFSIEPISRMVLRRYIKKIEYFLSWIKSYNFPL